jgi:hypothetical protein
VLPTTGPLLSRHARRRFETNGFESFFTRMDKRFLLERLSIMRGKAEAAHLEVVVQTSLLTQAKMAGRSDIAAEARLRPLIMHEQKLLRELNWLLDQLDRMER